MTKPPILLYGVVYAGGERGEVQRFLPFVVLKHLHPQLCLTSLARFLIVDINQSEIF